MPITKGDNLLDLPVDDGWISVDEAIPPLLEDVLTWDGTMVDMQFLKQQTRDGLLWWSEYVCTHWRPLPPPPKEKP